MQMLRQNTGTNVEREYFNYDKRGKHRTETVTSSTLSVQNAIDGDKMEQRDYTFVAELSSILGAHGRPR